MAQEVDPAAALHAMAAGEAVGEDAHTEPADGAEQPAAPAGDAPAIPLDAPADAPAADASPAIPMAQPAQAASRGARYDQMAEHAASQRFKKTLIIPLLVFGVLLLAGAIYGLVLILGGSNATLFKVVVLSSFVMGAILLVGAWLFHHETREH